MENWTKTKIGDLCQTFSGGTPSRTVSRYFGGNIPWIKSGELNSRLVIKTEESITEEAVKNSSAKFVNPNTILVAMYGATAGVIAISKIRATINQAILAVIPNNGSFENLYLFYQLEHSMSEVLKNLQGAQPNLNAEIIKNTIIPLPPLAEQKKIAEILSTWDKSIETTEKLIAAKQKLKKSLMQRLLTSSQRFPEFHGQEWKLRKFGEFLTESRISGSHGALAKKITVKLYGKGVFEKRERNQGSENTKYYKRKTGQFIYSKLDFLNGAFGLIPEKLNDFESTLDLPTFNISENLSSSWLLYYVSREDFYSKFIGSAEGGRKARRVQPDEFLQIKLKFPSLEEQKKIAAVLEKCDAEINVLQSKLAALRQQKRGLMQKLLTGRVRVKTEEN